MKDSTDLPVVTASNVLNAGAQRARSLVLPRTGLALRALRRRVGLL